jgi:NAD(P)-dependent dehydrogenase (short-subunit alcohol dehydrogenase family)
VTATELAAHGAAVILAVRNSANGDAAVERILAAHPGARVSVRVVDVASQASVRRFAAAVTGELDRLDVLVNNAGAENLGARRTTVDGFEFHLGTNTLGHFALTGLLLPLLERAASARVVSLSSITHKNAHLDFDDLQSEHGFNPNRAYGMAKLASTVFGLELDRRLRGARSSAISVLAHPGLSRSNFIDSAWQDRGPIGKAAGRLFSAVATQPTEQGALPQLYAATAAGVRGSDFYGPDGRGERRGDVTSVRPSLEAADPVIGTRFWDAAQELTGYEYL